MSRWVLASASPRRRELLALLGHPFDVVSPSVDESPHDGESGAELTLRLASAKAIAASDAARLVSGKDVVIAADTVVVAHGVVLGKPRDPASAVSMLRLLADSAHEVTTGVAVVHDGELHTASVTTRVTFTPMTDEEITAYVATGEPMDKAGAYGIQGIGGRFVERVDGNYHNVVGLPLPALVRLLRDAGEPI